MGATVRFFSELLAVNGRRAEFRVVARLGEKIVGEGFHQRAVIDVARFAEKTQSQPG
jgi:predicted thioesterase